MSQYGFVAYPGGKPLVADAIGGAVELAKNTEFGLMPWEAMEVVGFKVDDLVREQIAEAAVVVADITYPNPNVFYEIGFAMGLGKPVLPTINTAIDGSIKRVQQLGLFDTTGWAPYSNASDLHSKIENWPDAAWTNKFVRRKNHGQPLFILDTLAKTDFRNHIFHSVDNSQVSYRNFDPDDVPRLTAAKAIAEASASAGIILPLLSTEIVDAYAHNLRASFLLGLSHGFDIEPLAIQYGNSPAPLDYRDFVTNSTYRHETERHVEHYAAKVLVWNQKAEIKGRSTGVGLLAEIDLGSPTAENETQNLAAYFVETAEFSRALRAEGAVVIGRKGSGKSAVHLQVAERLARNRDECIVDLRPASHNLSEMREALLDVVSAGVFDHTIAAFWQFIIYNEILLKIRELALPLSRNDSRLQDRLRAIEDEFSISETMVSGDFTSRLEMAVWSVIDALTTSADKSDVRDRITNLMFEEPIPKLREAICSFADLYNRISILIDDLDKGWPPRQVEKHDVTMVKHLIEVLNRIQRDLGRKNVELAHLLFLRSDIYERLVEETSDRGKYNVIKVDWSDKEQLLHLLRQRVVSNLDPARHDDAWGAINPTVGNGTQAVDLLIDHSLRRPRFLIDLGERVLSYAINRGHQFVTEEDVHEGLRQMSLYLVSDFGYEMRDIAGTPEDIFYEFIGVTELLAEEEIVKILEGSEFGLDPDETIELLLWYGFLGLVGPSNEAIYIYDRAYDFRMLEAERPSKPEDTLFAVNPAFLEGLRRTIN